MTHTEGYIEYADGTCVPCYVVKSTDTQFSWLNIIIVILIIAVVIKLYQPVNSNPSVSSNPSVTAVEKEIFTTKYVWDIPQGFPNWRISGKKWKWDIATPVSGGSLFKQGVEYTKHNEGARVRNGRFMCYKDTSTKKRGGLLTCGIGICVDPICGGVSKLTVRWKGKTYQPDKCWRTCGISHAHAQAAFYVHYQEMIDELTRRTNWFSRLSINKQIVIVDMAFNLGKGTFIRGSKDYWSNTVSILASGQYARFIRLIRNYPYCNQVGWRCSRNIKMFRG